MSGPCVTLQSFLAVVLPCVDFWGPWPRLLLLMYVVGMGGAGQRDCCQEFCHLPLLLLRANCPGFRMGPPYPLLRSPPPPPTPSAGSLPFPPLGTMGSVGAVALSGHLCLWPRPAAIHPLPQPLHVLSGFSESGFSLILWRMWNRSTFFFSHPETYLEHRIYLEFQPRKGDSPLRDSSHIWLSSLPPLFLQSLPCSPGGNSSASFLPSRKLTLCQIQHYKYSVTNLYHFYVSIF